MTSVKAKTGKIFIPVSIQNNPLNPDTEMLILMRTTENSEILGIEVGNVRDENILAKRFSVRDFQFSSPELEHQEQLLA